MARFLAWIVDMLAVQGAVLAMTKTIMLVGVFSNDLASGLYLIGTFAITLGHGIAHRARMALEWADPGQTSDADSSHG